MTISITPRLNCHRADERFYNTYKVFVRAVSASGESLKFNTTTENVSDAGLYLVLPWLLAYDSPIFTFIRLPNNVGLAAIGRIVRLESQERELIGTAIRFSRTRLLPSPYYID